MKTLLVWGTLTLYKISCLLEKSLSAFSLIKGLLSLHSLQNGAGEARGNSYKFTLASLTVASQFTFISTTALRDPGKRALSSKK